MTVWIFSILTKAIFWKLCNQHIIFHIFRKNRYNALKKIMDDKKVEQEKALELPQPAVECGEEARAGHINGGYSSRGSRGRDKYDSSKYEPRFHREVSHAVMQSCSHAVAEIMNINSVSGTSLYTGYAIRIYFCLYLSVSKIFFNHFKK